MIIDSERQNPDKKSALEALAKIREQNPKIYSKSNQISRRFRLPRTLALSAVGLAVALSVTSGYAENAFNALAQESTNNRSGANLAEKLQVEGVDWQVVPGSPKWNYRLTNDGSKILNLVRPEDNFKVNSSYPFVTRELLHKSEGPINAGEESSVYFRFSVTPVEERQNVLQEDEDTPYVTDGGIQIYDLDAKQFLTISDEDSHLKIHQLPEDDINDMRKASQMWDLGELPRHLNGSVKVEGGVSFGRDGIKVTKADGSNRIIDSKPSSIRRFVVNGFTRRGANTNIEVLNVETK